jgi:Zn-dependent peptidase ImmA (M78 family)/transcriptional regulator with XRE-family HTH domain
MPKSVTALIEPSLLLWARTVAGISLADAAKKAKTTPDALEKWEEGATQPSVAKLRVLATAYKRPIAVFYLPHPPKDFTPLRDYRRRNFDTAVSQSSALLYAERRAHERREAALDLFEDVEGLAPAKFDLTASLTESPDAVGDRVREWLGMSLQTQYGWKDTRQGYNGWRGNFEKKGVLAFQSTGVPVDEMRGFSIGEFPLPAVVVNGRDAYAARSFSLLHELIHLALRAPGICDLRAYKGSSQEKQIEAFCNAAAAASLVPATAFSAEEVLAGSPVTEWPEETLRHLAGKYSVSKDVVLRRLLTLGKTSPIFYRKKILEWQAAQQSRTKKTKVRVSPAQQALSGAGRLFTQLLIDGYNQRTITASALSEYLGVKLGQLSKVEQLLTTRRAG